MERTFEIKGRFHMIFSSETRKEPKNVIDTSGLKN